MHFLPIFSTLRRHRTATALIVLEIAVTCAIVCNAVFLIRERLARMDRPTGLVEDEVLYVELANIGTRSDQNALQLQDLDALRAIPGVKSVAGTNMVPFCGSSWNSDISTKPDDPVKPISASTYVGTPDLVETLGLRLVAGRDFTADEYVQGDETKGSDKGPSSVIITQGIADRLFAGQNPLGQKLYVWGGPQVVVGVVEHLSRVNEFFGPAGAKYAVILPVMMWNSRYVLRVDPGRRAEVLGAIDAALDKVDSRRLLLRHEPFTEMRAKYYEADRAMAWLLVGVSIALLIITALGIIGLASFWVQQRTRQIGIRRALGATRGDIRRYFQTENFILATLGIVIGMGLAYAINLWLMSKYEVPRLPAMFLPVGAVVLWMLGQLAVLGPARRASAIPPAIATRSV
jgi:putative ABC transport system permease protein